MIKLLSTKTKLVQLYRYRLIKLYFLKNYYIVLLLVALVVVEIENNFKF